MPAHLRTLGTVSLSAEDPSAVDAGVLAQPKRLGLLGYLALAGRERWVSRQELLGLFWPETTEERARKALSQTLWVLRSQLGEDAVQKRGNTDLRLDASRVSVDAWVFRDAVDRGDDEGALRAYGGEFLPGLVVTGAPSFERWLEEERSALRRMARDAGWRLAEAARTGGDLTAARHWTRAAYEAAGPQDEDAVRRLMASLAEEGDRRGALDLFEALRRELAAEGEVPLPETQAVADALRPGAATPLTGPDSADPRGRRPRSPLPDAPSRQETDPGDAPPVPTLPSPPHGATPARRRPWPLAIALGAAALVTLFIVQAAWSGRADPDSGPLDHRIAVLPFPVEGSVELDYLGNAVVDLLSARLDGAGELSSVDPAAVLAAVEAGSEPGRRLGATLLVRGRVVSFGSGVELHATVERPDGSVLHRALVSARSEEGISTALDELAIALLGGILESRGGALDYGASQETRSLPALKAYLKGEADFRAFRLEEAAQAFQEAVALDTAFALAHFRLNRLGDWLGDPALVAGLDRAMAHRERLPRRHRRLLDAHVAFWRTSVPEGLRLLEAAAAAYPNDADAWFQLGDARFHGTPRMGGSIFSSEEPFRKALELNPRDQRAALHLMGLAAYRRDVAEARRLAAHFSSTDPTRRFQAAAFSLPADAPLPAILVHLDSLSVEQLNAVSSVADFLERPDILAAAGRRMEVEGGTPDWERSGLLHQVLAAEAGGRPGDSDAALLRMDRVAPDYARMLRLHLWSLPWRPAPPPEWAPGRAASEIRNPPEMLGEGILALRSGRTARVDSLMASTMESTDGPRRMAGYLLQAESALARGRPAEGLAYLDEARSRWNALAGLGTFPFVSHEYERFLRARLLEEAGRPEDALAWYSTMAVPVSHSLHFAAPAHQARARILAALGRHAEAEEARARVAHLLKDAEPASGPQTVATTP